MIKEFCAENFTDVPKAIAAGASRIELCDNLAVGGTTPSIGVIQTTVEYADKYMTEVMVMIRPRGGDFAYNQQEILTMSRDIRALQDSGAKGVVFGAVRHGWIDEVVMSELINLTSPLDITFHMAFDAIDQALQFKAIDWLVEHGVNRILTHGGASDLPIEETIPHLKRLVQYANGRIIILPGGGINAENYEAIVKALSVNEVHGTKIVTL